MYVLSRFTHDLAAYVGASEAEGRSSNLTIVTYNRVGEGLLGPRTVKGGVTIDLYQGLLSTSITADRMFSPEPLGENESGRLTIEQVADFFAQVGEYLEGQVKALDRSTLFVVYAGEPEKFSLAVNFISRLSSLAQAAGKGGLAKFYLLTCNHDLAEKVRLAEPLRNTGLLESVVYNPGGACGGLTDLQTIAETILSSTSESI